MKIRHFHSFAPERKKISWKRWLAFVLVILCAGSLIYTANLDGYQIRSVVVTGAVLTDEAKVKEIADQNISGRYFFLIPKTFIWAYPRSDIKKQIKALISVSDVDVSPEGESGVLSITIKELAQKYLWCPSAGQAGTVDNSQCYYMDDRGFVFSEAPLLEGNAFISFSGLIDGDPSGKYFLPDDKMKWLVEFMDGVRDIGFAPREVKAISISEIYIVLQSGTDLIISLDKPLDGVLENLRILKDSPDFTNASGGVEKTKYIDLRYGAKAFWK